MNPIFPKRMSEDHKKTLQTQLWNIANTLRGKMGADEFRDYILGFIFYKYLSERMHLFADEILKHDGIQFDQPTTPPSRARKCSPPSRRKPSSASATS